MIILWADQVAKVLTIAQLAFAVAVMSVALLKVPGRPGGLAGTLKALAFMPVTGFIAISMLVDPLLSEAHADRSWLLILSLLLLDAVLLYLGLALASAASRAAAAGSRA